MAYKFQKGTANLSGSIKLDSGYDLLGAGSNDLGTSAANFAVGYVSIVSASTVVSGAFFEGDASRMTGIAATDVTTTGTSTDATYYPLFVDTAAGESGETVRVHSTVAINPGTGLLSATTVSASTGTGSFGGGISAGNEGFTVGYTGAVTATTISGSGALSVGAGATMAGALNMQAGGITNAGAIAGATTVAMGGAFTGATTITGSGALSIGAGATLAGALDMQQGGINNAGAIAKATTISGSGALSVGAGATLAGALNMQSAGITNAGSIAGATTLAMGGALTGATTMSGSGAVTVDSITLGEDYSISSAGAASVASVNVNAGGITNAGAIAGATTIAMGGDLTGVSALSASGGITGSQFSIRDRGLSPTGNDTQFFMGTATVGGGTNIIKSYGSTLLIENEATGASGDTKPILLRLGSNDAYTAVKIRNASNSDLFYVDGTGAASGSSTLSALGITGTSLNVQAGGITNAGVIAGTTLLTASTGLSGTTIYANKLFGDGAGITGISLSNADTVDVTSSTSNVTYGLVFTQGAQTDGGLGLALQLTGATFNPATAELSGSGALSVGGGATMAGALNMQAGGITNAGAIAGATTGAFSDTLTVASITSSAGSTLSVGGGVTLAGNLNVQGGNIESAGTISGSGALSVGAGATMAGALNMQAGGITNAGAIAGATTISGSGAVTVDSITLNGDYSISNAGAAVVASLNVSDGNITNVGDINCDSVSVDDSAVGLNIDFGGTTGLNKISLTDNLADALNITQAGNSYIKLVTTDDEEAVVLGYDLQIRDGYNIAAKGDMGIDIRQATTGQSGLSMTDNLASAFYIHQGGTSYLKFVTTNDGEQVLAEKDFIIGANVNSDVVLGINGPVDFYSQKLLTASVNLDEDASSGFTHSHTHYICSGSSAITIDLPALENGASLWVKRHPSMTNNVTLSPSGSTHLIDGLNDPVVLETAGASLQLVASGSLNWYIY